MKIALFALIALFLTGCSTVSDLFSEEEEVALDAMPAAVVRAARNAVPGIELLEAEREKEDGQYVYELEGVKDGQRYEIEVGLNGEVIEVEQIEG